MDGKDLNFKINIESGDSVTEVKNIQKELRKLTTSLKSMTKVTKVANEATASLTKLTGPVTKAFSYSFSTLGTSLKATSSNLNLAMDSVYSLNKAMTKSKAVLENNAHALTLIKRNYDAGTTSIAATEKAIASLKRSQKTANAEITETNILLSAEKSAYTRLIAETEKLDEKNDKLSSREKLEVGILKNKGTALKKSIALYKEEAEKIKLTNNKINNTVSELSSELTIMKKLESERLKAVAIRNKETEAIERAAAASIKDRSKSTFNVTARSENAFDLNASNLSEINSVNASLVKTKSAMTDVTAAMHENSITIDKVTANYTQYTTSSKLAKQVVKDLNSQYSLNSAKLKELSQASNVSRATINRLSVEHEEETEELKQKRAEMIAMQSSLDAYKAKLNEENMTIKKNIALLRLDADALTVVERAVKAGVVTRKENLSIQQMASGMSAEEIARLHATVDAYEANQKRLQSLNNAMYRTSIVSRQVGTALSRYITTPLIAAAAASAKYTAEIEMQEKAFGILLSDMEEGAELYEKIIDYAARTPYQITDLNQAAKELLAFGSQPSNVMDELGRLGDLAQNDAEKLDSVVKAFGKVEARGTAHMRELNRFVSAGVPIFEELQNVMNMDSAEFISSVRAGTVTFESVKQAVENLTSVGGKFYDMSDILSQTVSGRFSTMKDEVALAGRALVDDFMPEIKKVINKIITFSQALQGLSKEQKTSLLRSLALTAALGPLLLLFSNAIKITSEFAKILPGAITLFKSFVGVLTGSSVGAGAAVTTAGLAGGPVGWAVLTLGAITALVTYIVGRQVKKKILDTTEAFRDLNEEISSWNSTTSIETVQASLAKNFQEKTGDLMPENIKSVFDKEFIAEALKNDPDKLQRTLETLSKQYMDAQDTLDDMDAVRNKLITDYLASQYSAREYFASGNDSEYFSNISAEDYLKTDEFMSDFKEALKNETGKTYEEYQKIIEDYNNSIAGISTSEEINLPILSRLSQMLIGSAPDEPFESLESLLFSYINTVEDTITDSTERLNKYATDVPQTNLLREILDKVMGEGVTLEELEAEYGSSEWTTFLASYVGNINDSAAKKAAYNVVTDLFDQFDIILDSAQKDWLDEKGGSFFTENMSDFLIGGIDTELTAAQQKEQAEALMDSISEAISGSVSAMHDEVAAELGEGATAAEITKESLDRVRASFGFLFESYEKLSDKLPELTLAASFEAERDELEANIITYGKSAKAIAEYTYALEGQHDEHLNTLSDLAGLQSALDSLSSMVASDLSGIDPTELTAIFDALPTIDVLSNSDSFDKEKALKDAQKVAIDYFAELYSLDEQEKAQKLASDEHKDFLKSLNEYSSDLMNMIPDTPFQSTGVFNFTTDYINLEGLRKYLKETSADIQAELSEVGFTTDELIIKRLETIKEETEDTDIKKLIDQVVKGISDIDDATESLELQESFDETKQSLIDEIALYGLVGDALIEATFAAENFNKEQIKELTNLQKIANAYETLSTEESNPKVLTSSDPAKLLDAINALPGTTDTEAYAANKVFSLKDQAVIQAKAEEFYTSLYSLDAIEQAQMLMLKSTQEFAEKYKEIFGSDAFEELKKTAQDNQFSLFTEGQLNELEGDELVSYISNLGESLDRELEAANVATDEIILEFLERTKKTMVASGESITEVSATIDKLKELMDTSSDDWDLESFAESLQSKLFDDTGGLKGDVNNLIKVLKDANAELVEETAKLGESAVDMFITSLENLKETVKETEGAVEQIDAMIEGLKKASDDADTFDFAEKLKDIGQELLNVGLESLNSELYEMGEALANASLAANDVADSLADIMEAIMTALPSLLLQAGVEVLVDNWMLGLGLIAASGLVSFANGFFFGDSDDEDTTDDPTTVTFSANGNAFDKGSIVSVPTITSTSYGYNVSGEAGTEGVLPLRRNSSGQLGVIASGGGSSSTNVSVPVNITINNETGVEVEATQTSSTGSDGSQNIEVIIKRVVTSQITDGSYDRPMSSRYGTSYKGVS